MILSADTQNVDRKGDRKTDGEVSNGSEDRLYTGPVPFILSCGQELVCILSKY